MFKKSGITLLTLSFLGMSFLPSMAETSPKGNMSAEKQQYDNLNKEIRFLRKQEEPFRTDLLLTLGKIKDLRAQMQQLTATFKKQKQQLDPLESKIKNDQDEMKKLNQQLHRSKPPNTPGYHH